MDIFHKMKLSNGINPNNKTGLFTQQNTKVPFEVDEFGSIGCGLPQTSRIPELGGIMNLGGDDEYTKEVQPRVEA